MVNGNHSFKDYTNITHKIDLSDAEGQIIKGSCFYSEEGSSFNSSPFLNLNICKAKDITFQDCNMDNCIIPPDCTLIDCCNKFIRYQDNKPWRCNSSGVFVEVFNG